MTEADVFLKEEMRTKTNKLMAEEYFEEVNESIDRKYKNYK